jgi:hypothetical protein
MQIDARDDTGGSRVLFRKRHRPQEYLPQEDEKKKKKTLVYPVLSLPIQLVQLGSGIFDIKVKTLFVKKFKLFLFKIIFFVCFND